jgi:hypothetical protein
MTDMMRRRGQGRAKLRVNNGIGNTARLGMEEELGGVPQTEHNRAQSGRRAQRTFVLLVRFRDQK